MNATLAQLYGTADMNKTASEEEAVTLEQVSAADFLAAVNAGEVNLADFIEDDGEKVASDEGEIDLSQFSDEELMSIINEIDGDSEKTASDEETAYWDAAGRMMARGYADELSKEASEEGGVDLNQLDAQEIVELGYALHNEMSKEASEEEDFDIDLNQLTAEEFIELAGALEGEMGKHASESLDLNELSVDEFLTFAGEVEGELMKTAKEDKRTFPISRALTSANMGGAYGGLAGAVEGAGAGALLAKKLGISRNKAAALGAAGLGTLGVGLGYGSTVLGRAVQGRAQRGRARVGTKGHTESDRKVIEALRKAGKSKASQAA